MGREFRHTHPQVKRLNISKYSISLLFYPHPTQTQLISSKMQCVFCFPKGKRKFSSDFQKILSQEAGNGPENGREKYIFNPFCLHSAFVFLCKNTDKAYK